MFPRWQIAAYEILLMFAVAGAAGWDIWLSRLVAVSQEPLAVALRTTAEWGNSKWSLVIAGCAIAALLLIRRQYARASRRALLGWLAEAATFVFAAVAVSGITANVLKVIFGRARLVALPSDRTAEFQLFALDWQHHSFPSGHATTLFALAMALAFLLPGWRRVLFVLAAIGAVGRIAAGAHFLSDIVAGAVLGAAVTWWMRGWLADRGWVFVRRPGAIEPRRIGRHAIARFRAWPTAGGAELPSVLGGDRPRNGARRLCERLLILGLLAAPLFIFVPVDRWIASLFYLGGGAFWLTDSWVGDLFHDVLRPAFYWVLIAGVILLGLVGFLKPGSAMPTVRRLVYVIAVFGLGVGLLTNAILKDQWDRPRPLQTTAFGGEARYQPPLIPTKGCERNCSFVSGDASAAFALVALPLAFAAGRRRRRLITATLWFGVVIGLLRMLNGSHFASDVFYAGIFNVALAAALYTPIIGWRAGDFARHRVALWHGITWLARRTAHFAGSVRNPRPTAPGSDSATPADGV
ncbi:MAG: phosphatase PAP2 family protein [Pseudomonadota bacterium]|nr:phosphatase PAP2 family protein [Pseudomonadota bacterium]